MNNQFMLSDLARTAEAVLVFSLVVLTPGYVLAWLLELMDFRRRLFLTRLAIAIPLSIGVCPIVTYLLGRFVPPGIWVFYGSCAIGFFALLVVESHKLLSPPGVRAIFKQDFVFLAIAATWAVVAALTLVDLQIGHRLYFPTVAYDYSLRATLTSSITRWGVPAQNPFFFTGRTYGMHYHYLWFILCSVAQRITGSTVSSRQAVIAGTIWCGIGLLGVTALYIRFFQSKGPVNLRRRTMFAMALLAVTGLDIIPVAYIESMFRGFYADLEWWNEQVSAWITTVLWTPHHLAGLIACLTAFLLLWDAAKQPGKRRRIASALTAGVIFASSAGMTIHVTFVFAIFLLIWMAMEFRRGHRSSSGLMLLAGLAAAVVALPFLTELVSHEPGTSGGSAGAVTFPLQLMVRSFRFFDTTLGLTGNDWKINLANLIALPLNYFLELGFFLVVGIIECKRMWRNRASLSEDQLCGFTMAATSILICTFISSSVATGNDLGWRGFLPAQFILLLWGAELLADGLKSRVASHDMRLLIVATLVLGAAGSLYALVKVRFYPVLSDITSTPLYPWLSPDRNLGARTFDVRQVYDELRSRTPARAVFQHNPNTSPSDLFHGIYADRQVAVEGMGCGVYYGGDANLCKERIGPIDDLFENPKSYDATQIDDLCGRFSINVLVVKDTDKVWKDKDSWIWKRMPMLANDHARAFNCGPQSR